MYVDMMSPKLMVNHNMCVDFSIPLIGIGGGGGISNNNYDIGTQSYGFNYWSH